MLTHLSLLDFRNPKCNCINMTLFSSKISSNEGNYFKRKVVTRLYLAMWRQLGNISMSMHWAGSMLRERVGPGRTEQHIENNVFNILRSGSFSLVYLPLFQFFFSKIHGKTTHCTAFLF